MINKETLAQLIHKPSVSKTSIVLLCLATGVKTPKPPKKIKELATEAGLPSIKKWNVSSILGKCKHKVARPPGGWILTQTGKDHVNELIAPHTKPGITKVASSLRSHLAKIKNPQTSEFVDQAIKCYEAEYYRAAVVLSWVGAVALLQDHVIKNKLADFNKNARQKNPKWKNAKTSDDFSRMKESDFLEVIAGISVVGKSAKIQLKNRLDFRNGCGHPNSLQIAEHQVSSHLEFLILNVFSKF